MDAAHYARVRELFLAAEELPPGEQETFLRIQTGDDVALFEDVRSLLAEHDPESAKLEGNKVAPLKPPPAMDPQRSASGPRVTSRKSAGDQTTRRGDSKSSAIATQENRKRASQITLHGAERTHASPRDLDTSRPRSSPGAALWAQRTRQSRRSTSRWMWLAALLPTALVGWWTLHQVRTTMNNSVRHELSGVADSVALATERYLQVKAQLVESWSRQPKIQQAIKELVELADGDPPADQLRQAPQSEEIKRQLQTLSGFDDVKFVVWNDSYLSIASWREDRSDIGMPVHHTGAANLTRVMRGETVLFGPERLADIDGVDPDTDRPVMAIIVPIRGDKGRVVAAMSVRGFEMFDEFDRMFAEVSTSGGWDAYAINDEGTMLTASMRAKSLATLGALDLEAEQVAATLRVADPGYALTPENAKDLQRAVRPLTVSVAGATIGSSDVRIEQYNNYAGQPVVGAWRWNPVWQMGVIIERDAASAFAPARIVRFSFLVLGSLLTLTAFGAAAVIASRSARDHAAIHPLSRYEVVSELGSGGMGVVYRARHRQLGRETALKVLRGDRHNKEDRLRFDREARLAASLSSPHSVMIYDYGRSDEGEAFCVMEFLRGLTLNEVVSRGGHQPFGRVLFIMSQICDALAEAHGLNLLHRDIKPQNVMLSLDASVGDWAVVFDYGLAKPLEPDVGVYQTAETVWAGTPMYMAPERFREPSVMDPRSDIYSVGCVAYYLLSGRPPFIECDPESLFALIITQEPISIAVHRDQPVPDEINEMVMRCMKKNAEERFDSIAALSKVIDDLRSRYPWTVEEARQWWQTHGGD